MKNLQLAVKSEYFDAIKSGGEDRRVPSGKWLLGEAPRWP